MRRDVNLHMVRTNFSKTINQTSNTRQSNARNSKIAHSACMAIVVTLYIRINPTLNQSNNTISIYKSFAKAYENSQNYYCFCSKPKIDNIPRQFNQVILICLLIKYSLLLKLMAYHQKYTEKQFIGRGNYGKVYLIYDNKTLQLYVAKKISLEGLKFLEIDRTMREIQIHKHLNHPNIIAFKQYFLQDDILVIVMEMVYADGDLSVYIKNRQQKNELFEQALIMNLFIQLVLGVQYLHQHKIVHRDIKPQNIFINQDGVLKLADFGISKALDQTQEKAMTLVGTPYYLSPQACKNEGYTAKSDIWALGCVLYELSALKHAFQGSNVLSLANKITNDPIQPINSQYSAELFELIKMLLRKDPQTRPTVSQILENNYVRLYTSNFSQMQLEPYVQKQEQNEQYQNQFMPNVQKEYCNQFLEDENFHPRSTSKSSNSQTMRRTVSSKSSMEEEISPRKSAALKLREKCKKKLGDSLFQEMYSLMRKLKGQGKSQIEIQSKIRQKYSRSEFNQAMDVAQLIYIEDNH